MKRGEYRGEREKEVQDSERDRKKEKARGNKREGESKAWKILHLPSFRLQSLPETAPYFIRWIQTSASSYYYRPSLSIVESSCWIENYARRAPAVSERIFRLPGKRKEVGNDNLYCSVVTEKSQENEPFFASAWRKNVW